jgi:hypothetical protein
MRKTTTPAQVYLEKESGASNFLMKRVNLRFTVQDLLEAPDPEQAAKLREKLLIEAEAMLRAQEEYVAALKGLIDWAKE